MVLTSGSTLTVRMQQQQQHAVGQSVVSRRHGANWRFPPANELIALADGRLCYPQPCKNPNWCLPLEDRATAVFFVIRGLRRVSLLLYGD
jgi:hypothetical protein